MIVFCNSTCAKDIFSKEDMSNIVTLNLSSYWEYGYKLKYLIPNLYNKEKYNDLRDKIEDIAYADYLVNCEDAFKNIMAIVHNFYLGMDVIILINDESDYYTGLTESLIKFIQQRYGINSYIIQDYEDYQSVDECQSMTVEGIYNLDNDKMRLILGTLFEDKDYRERVEKAIEENEYRI